MGKSTDATRAERKAKKRALEAAIPDLPGDDNVEDVVEAPGEPSKERKDKGKKRKRGGEDEEAAAGDESLKSKRSKKDRKGKEEDGAVPAAVEDVERLSRAEKKTKKDKKLSKANITIEVEDIPPGDGDTAMEEAPEAPKKSKKERKAERRAQELAAHGTRKKEDEAIEPVLETDGSGQATKQEKKPKEKAETSEEKKSKKNNRNKEKKRKGSAEDLEGREGKDKKPARFIVFVGNLPFSATTDSIKAHFASVHPQSVRHLTKKEDPTKSKGCAFVEFAGYDHMKTCLKLMHHSTFDDGKSAPRKINVELTAGGGGNTVERKSKIEAKNTKLNEERIRKIREEEKAKLEKASEGAKNGTAAIDESAIHPSRRGRVPAMTGK